MLLFVSCETRICLAGKPWMSFYNIYRFRLCQVLDSRAFFNVCSYTGNRIKDVI